MNKVKDKAFFKAMKKRKSKNLVVGNCYFCGEWIEGGQEFRGDSQKMGYAHVKCVEGKIKT